MRVKELVELLKLMPQEAQVVVFDDGRDAYYRANNPQVTLVVPYYDTIEEIEPYRYEDPSPYNKADNDTVEVVTL